MLKMSDKWTKDIGGIKISLFKSFLVFFYLNLYCANNHTRI